ncbi:hypothetical protein KL939_004358 [Ogataea angusta]|nr:hypothetical protein KL939_004358 [Ogataea angusta]
MPESTDTSSSPTSEKPQAWSRTSVPAEKSRHKHGAVLRLLGVQKRVPQLDGRPREHGRVAVLYNNLLLN